MLKNDRCCKGKEEAAIHKRKPEKTYCQLVTELTKRWLNSLTGHYLVCHVFLSHLFSIYLFVKPVVVCVFYLQWRRHGVNWGEHVHPHFCQRSLLKLIQIRRVFTGGGVGGSLRLQTPVIGSPCLSTRYILTWRRPCLFVREQLKGETTKKSTTN